MKNLLFVLLATLFCATSTFAQKDETLFNRSGVRLTGAWGGSSLSISKLENENAIYRGGFGGLEFNKSIFLGWGGMELQSDARLEGGDITNMDYNGFIAGYAPAAHKAFHPQFMLMVGGGNVTVSGETPDKILVIQPSVGVEINVFRWFRIGLNGGYRIVNDTEFASITDSDLSTPYGEVKFKFGWSWGK